VAHGISRGNSLQEEEKTEYAEQNKTNLFLLLYTLRRVRMETPGIKNTFTAAFNATQLTLGITVHLDDKLVIIVVVREREAGRSGPRALARDGLAEGSAHRVLLGKWVSTTYATVWDI
jgi:hypothetical protein